MNYSEKMNELMDELNKSINTINKLDYFKKELNKILDAQENKDDKISKSIESADYEMQKTMFQYIGIQKARGYGVGTIREWKGQKYRKIAPGKWRRIYTTNSRGAMQSVRIIKSKIMAAKTVDELLQLVMENINRFQDENGKLLPIVEELKKEVNASKNKINAGKPTTQEQIEKYKKEQKKADKPYTETKIENIKVGDKIHYVGGDYNVLSIEKDPIYTYLQIGEKRTIGVKEGASIKLVNENYENEYGKRVKNVIEQIGKIKDSDKDIHDKINELRKIKDDESKYFYDMLHENDKGKISGDDYYQQERIYYNGQYDNLVDKYLNPVINELFANTPEQLEKKRKEQEEKDRKKNALKNKLDSINKNYKYEYSDAEIKKAFEAVDSIQKDIDKINERYKQTQKERKENENRMQEIRAKSGYLTNSVLIRDNPEYKLCNEKDDELRSKTNDIHFELLHKESEINKYMDPIADYYLKKDYEKDTKIDSCKTIEEVADLIKSKDWYNDKGKELLNLKGIDLECGKIVFKSLERLFAIFPERKGISVSVKTYTSNSNTWATGSYWDGITLNKKYWKSYKVLSADIDTSGSFHPADYEINSIIYHEYYHTITTKNDLASTIKQKVSASLKLDDRKSGVKKNEIIAKGISEYATKNADEFGAEAFGECLSSKNPSAFAREVFKETIKHVKILKDDK